MSFPIHNGVEVLRLPPSNYEVDFDNPKSNKVLEHFLIFGIGGSLALVALCQRVYTKIFLSKGLGIDDGFMFIGWIGSVATQALMTLTIVEKGFCYHSWEMPLARFERYAYISYIAAPVYMLCTGFVKLSLLAFYLQLSPQKWFRISICVSIAIVACYTIIITFLMLFNCNPPKKQYDFHVVGGSCIDAAILYMATAVSNIITDIILFVLPLPMVYQLHMPRIQKAGAVVVFGIGSLTIATSIIRLALLPVVLKSTDPSWDAAPANIWSFVEANLLIICGSMPTLRKFFKHFAPRLMRSTSKSAPSYSAGYNQQHSNPLSRVRRSRPYTQFPEEEELEMRSFSDENITKTGVTVAVGVAQPDVSRDDYSDRAILQTTSVTVKYS